MKTLILTAISMIIAHQLIGSFLLTDTVRTIEDRNAILETIISSAS